MAVGGAFNDELMPLLHDKAMETVGIIDADEVVDFAIEPFPMLRLSQRTRDEDDSEDDSSAESDGAVEDAMFADMSEAEKIAVLRLKPDNVERLQRAFGEYERLVRSLQSEAAKGYIVSKRIKLAPQKVSVFVKKARTKQAKPTAELDQEAASEHKIEQQAKEAEKPKAKEEQVKFVYDEFVPFAAAPSSSQRVSSFATFNECVDEFFTEHEKERSEGKQSRKELVAMKKLATAKGQHDARIAELQQQARGKALHARIIEENLHLLDQAIGGVNTTSETASSRRRRSETPSPPSSFGAVAASRGEERPLLNLMVLRAVKQALHRFGDTEKRLIREAAGSDRGYDFGVRQRVLCVWRALLLYISPAVSQAWCHCPHQWSVLLACNPTGVYLPSHSNAFDVLPCFRPRSARMAS